jgi:hypothetical protein
LVLSKEKPIPYQPPLPPNEAPSGVDAAAGVTPVGLRPPFVTPAAAHSHPDCRGIPILIVALESHALPDEKLKNVGTEMALHVLAYNMKRVISILGAGGLMEAIRA